MAPRMGLRRLWPEFREGYRSGSRALQSISGGCASRSTQDAANRFHASPALASNLTKVSGLPNLFRRSVFPHYSWHNEKQSGAQKAIVWIYTDDVMTAGRDKLQEDISQCVQPPDNNSFSSTLNYSHDLANAALSASPSNRCALVEVRTKRHSKTNAAPYRWEVLCWLSRQDMQSSTRGIPSFTLRVFSEGYPTKIGPCPTFTNMSSTLSNFSIELHLRPKSLPLVAPFGGSADDSTHSVNDFVKELLDDLEHSLHECQFTSIVSWNEAVVAHLEDYFSRAKIDHYLELESMRLVSGKQIISGSHFLRWIHESPRSKADLHGYFLGKSENVLPTVLKLRHKGSPEVVESEAEATPMALTCEESNIKVVIHPYTLDIIVASNAQTNLTLSAIASRFEQRHARSIARDLPLILDGFLGVLQSLPSNITDPVTVRISRNSQTMSAERASSSPPTHSVELKKGITRDSVKVSILTDLQRSFQLRFKSVDWNDRPIKVKKILFQTSSIDAVAVNSLLDSSLSEQASIQQELNNLTTNATTIVQKVCEGVKFDDVTTVTSYLAEAVLRVVRPLTKGFVLESVTMDVVIGDDLVTLTKTVSMADLEARTRTPKRCKSPLDHVKVPSGYQATVSTTHVNPPSENIGKSGFSILSMQLLSPSVADYGPTDVYRKAMDIFDHGLKDLQNIDCFALQAILCNVGKELPRRDAVAIQLTATPSLLPDGIFAPVPCQIAVFSDGEAVCVLEPIILTSLTHETPGGPKSVRAVVQITLKGTPNQQVNGHLNARQQMALMHDVMASKCTTDFDGYFISHAQMAAAKIAEMTLEARSEFEDHFDINTVSVHFGVWANDGDHMEVAEPHHVHKSSAGFSKCKEAVAIEALPQELDAKLGLSVTSTSSNFAIASDETTRSTELDSNAKNRGQMQRGVVVALGSNVGNRVEEIEKACRAIDADPDMRIVDTSFLYETKPMYVEDQERFVNGACEIETSLTPIQLLDRLQAIEQGHGRVKLVDKGPRNIDLDIAIFRDEVVQTERLTVPHMLMHEREFVLRPIMDLRSMKEWRNPRSKTRLFEMFGTVLKSKLKDSSQMTEPMHMVTPLTTDAMMYPMDPCRKTLVMSILNTTPDSFSDGKSNTLDPQSLRETAASHIAAGATIIDVGGQSSRPNAPDVTAEEEINRVLPAIAAIKSLPEAEGIAISVDTYRAAVAEAAVNAGAHIVNDISAGMLDPQMLSTVARLGCTYVMMHMRGTPATMQSPENCTYKDIRDDITDELAGRVALAIEAGVRKWRIVLDPGIGFAKTQDQNIHLLRTALCPPRNGPRVSVRRWSANRLYRMPQLVGCSRKGFIGNITGVAEPKDRIFGTAAAVTASIRGGADIVRVHDVQEMVQAAKMADAIYRYENNPF